MIPSIIFLVAGWIYICLGLLTAVLVGIDYWQTEPSVRNVAAVPAMLILAFLVPFFPALAVFVWMQDEGLLG